MTNRRCATVCPICLAGRFAVTGDDKASAMKGALVVLLASGLSCIHEVLEGLCDEHRALYEARLGDCRKEQDAPTEEGVPRPHGKETN